MAWRRKEDTGLAAWDKVVQTTPLEVSQVSPVSEKDDNYYLSHKGSEKPVVKIFKVM